MKDTKQRILEIALALFARDGYEAVSTSQIAGELGITKGALYKHYKNKRDIFDSIVMQMQKQDSELAEQNEVPAEELSKVESQYKQITPAHFLAYSKEMFYHWTEDEFASNFRKMLTLEQYRDPEMCKLYHDYLGAGPRSYVKDILGVMGIKNPDAAATAFYGPMYLGYSLYDYAEDKEALKKQIFDAMDAAFASVTEELQ